MRIDRLNMIEQYVIQCKTASLEELATHFGVSMNTIRRDVRQLLERGALEKVYGGVTIKTSQHAQLPLPYAIRASRNIAEKQEIGRLASELVSDNASIFIDSGSTTPTILAHLATKSNVTVISHSLSALYEASKYPNLNVIALGGIFYSNTASYIDITSMDALSRLSIDTVFIGATGITLENGLTNTTYLEAEMKRIVIRRSRGAVLMADHSKFDSSSIITFCKFEDLSCVVTDTLPPQRYIDAMRINQIRLLCPETEKD